MARASPPTGGEGSHWLIGTPFESIGLHRANDKLDVRVTRVSEAIRPVSFLFMRLPLEVYVVKSVVTVRAGERRSLIRSY